MSHYVIDASIAVEYLLKTPLGLSAADIIEEATLVAPELLDVEIVSALRKGVLDRQIEEARALMVIEDLPHWPVERIPHRALTLLAWRHYRNVSAYDAYYVAAADAFGFPLLTSDGPLSRAPKLGITLQYFRRT